MTTVISVEHLSKAYHLGQISTGTFSRDLEVWWAKLRGKPNPLLRIGETDHGNRDGEELWALRDVSFTVQQGEVLGIIGRNGAGKSTLLKILSRVTAPTSGKIKVKGRIASLLEVGTGFHPELTGRENIYLNGAILGMKRNEITRKFDEIVDFAEVEKFIDTPVKRYSSGMYVRLAFAVAAHLEPEILVVDEVLAVGDVVFQQKCLGKMGDVAREGRTVLFVSHNMESILTLCQKAIVLTKGCASPVMPVNKGVDQYLTEQFEEHSYGPTYSLSNGEYRLASGQKVVLLDLSIYNHRTGKLASVIPITDGVNIRFVYHLLESIPFGRAGLDILDMKNTVILSTMDTDTAFPINAPRESGIYHAEARVPALLLMPGKYAVRAFLGIPRRERLMTEMPGVEFEIMDNNSHLSDITKSKREGYISTPIPWIVKQQ